MKKNTNLPQDGLQAVWQQIVDQASVLAIVEAACDTHLESPDPSHFMAVLRQVQRQLLEAADQLDRIKDDAGESES